MTGRGGQRGAQRRQSGNHRWVSRGRQKKCVFCEEKTLQIDYKQADMLRRFLTDHGKIQPRRRTGTCARHQRRLVVAIKRARHLALLPFVVESRPAGR